MTPHVFVAQVQTHTGACKTVDQKYPICYNSYIQLKNGAENDKKTLYRNGKRD
jgi:hypothetical protein